MDSTLQYSLIAGIAIVLIVVFARFVLRWAIRAAILFLILAVLAGGIWVWLNYNSSPAQSPPRSSGRIGN